MGLLGLGGKGSIDHLDLVGGGCVVGVDLGGLGVGVAEELLEGAERDLARSSELGGEGVAEVVEADGSDAGVAAGGLEAFGDFAAVEGVGGLRGGRRRGARRRCRWCGSTTRRAQRGGGRRSGPSGGWRGRICRRWSVRRGPRCCGPGCVGLTSRRRASAVRAALTGGGRSWRR